MNPRPQPPLIAVILCIALIGAQAAAEERPISGKKVPGFEPVDKAVLESMETIGCQAATIAVSKDGRLIYSRGYGWSDKEKKKRVSPDALMRIASVSKPITAAAVRNAIRGVVPRHESI
jgi:CubicO group peptidase (beta-lactamase class C family)